MLRSRTFAAVVVMSLACGTAARLLAQGQTAGGSLSFEVASVKPNAAGPLALQRVLMQGDRVTITNVPLLVIIQAAYRLDQDQIEGEPGWIGRERFDITAKADQPTSQERLREMLRALLADRFRLVAHTETRDAQVYALVMASRDGKPGPNLRLGTTGCAALRASAREAPQRNNDPCGSISRPGHQGMRGIDIDRLAMFLTAFAGRPVVNKTGLSGFVDYELRFTPQEFLQGPFNRERFPDINPDGPSIFTAVQEQLGFKLEPQTGPGEVLVVDRVERPTAD